MISGNVGQRSWVPRKQPVRSDHWPVMAEMIFGGVEVPQGPRRLGRAGWRPQDAVSQHVFLKRVREAVVPDMAALSTCEAGCLEAAEKAVVQIAAGVASTTAMQRSRAVAAKTAAEIEAKEELAAAKGPEA